MSALHDAMARLEEVAQDPHERRSVRSTEERNKLVEENQRLAAWGVSRYAKNAVRHDQDLFEDLRQAAFLGLLRAAESWDPSLGTFASYASDWIRQKVWRELVRVRGVIRLPYNIKGEEKRQARMRTQIEPMPPDAQHPHYTETPHLDQDEEYTWVLSIAKRCLTAQQLRAVQLCYLQGMTYQEAALAMGLGYYNVRTLLDNARKKLREEMGCGQRVSKPTKVAV